MESSLSLATATLQMPVLVEVPVNHETFRPISENLRARIDTAPKDLEEVAAESQRASARSARKQPCHTEPERSVPAPFSAYFS